MNHLVNYGILVKVARYIGLQCLLNVSNIFYGLFVLMIDKVEINLIVWLQLNIFFLALLYPLTIMVPKGHGLDTSLLDKKKNKKERKKDAELHKKKKRAATERQDKRQKHINKKNETPKRKG